jgi:NADPH-dependent curcumin reductase CurA
MTEDEKLVNQEIHLRQRPVGLPTEEYFQLAKTNVPDPKEGEFLVHNIWISVDPYMRGCMREIKSYISPYEIDKPLEGGCVGQIVKSNSDRFRVGDYVLGNLGWREYWASDGTRDVIKIDSNMAPIQWYLGILGLTGLSAYVGLLKIAQLSDDSKDTVFVSAAAGAVGSIACQIAKIKGCRVVGSAGSEEKVKWLLDQARIDHAFNYKEVGEENISAELEKSCPAGIDIYFDNVGGKHLEAAIDNMNTFGRIVLCGMISQYNSLSPPSTGPYNLFQAIPSRLKLQGFIVRDHYDVLNEFHADMSNWIGEGKIKWRETVFEGIENAPKAFLSLFKGGNIGKILVKVGF